MQVPWLCRVSSSLVSCLHDIGLFHWLAQTLVWHGTISLACSRWGLLTMHNPYVFLPWRHRKFVALYPYARGFASARCSNHIHRGGWPPLAWGYTPLGIVKCAHIRQPSPLTLPWICIFHNNTHTRSSRPVTNREGLGAFYHVNNVRWTQSWRKGEGPNC